MSSTREIAEYSSAHISLSGLLFTIVNHLDTVSCYKHNKKRQALLCKLSVERAILFSWGKSMGLLRETGKKFRPLDPRLNNNETRKVVQNLLGSIAADFEDMGELVGKYGLRRLGSDEAATKGVWLETSHVKIRCVSKKTQKKSSQRGGARWVVHDRARFADLIEEIRGYNESLNRLLPPVVSSEVVEVVVSHQSLISPGAVGQLGAPAGAQNGTSYSVEVSTLLPPNSTSTTSVHGSFEIQGQANAVGAPAYVPVIAPPNPPNPPYQIEEPGYYNNNHYNNNHYNNNLRSVDMGGRVLLLEAAPGGMDLVHIEEAKHPSECFV